MMTVSMCMLVSILSAASPSASYRHYAGSHATGEQSASQPVAQVNRTVRVGSINGRGQVWRTSDVRVESPATAARPTTMARSFLVAGK
jgi:hypothetical protein